jgi:putative endonuclease
MGSKSSEGVGDDAPITEWSTKRLGAEGESLAALYLERRGMTILDRNWRCDYGEVDVIAECDGETVLVEVKTRLDLDGDTSVMPEIAVDKRKRERYRRLALYYLASHPEVDVIRFDVIAIRIVGVKCAQVRHLMGAFVWDE